MPKSEKMPFLREKRQFEDSAYANAGPKYFKKGHRVFRKRNKSFFRLKRKKETAPVGTGTVVGWLWRVFLELFKEQNAKCQKAQCGQKMGCFVEHWSS